ncbi:MAG: proton-conducting transporter membrane subunit, partial [Propionicimonas sp.]|nr:proton-conducting transporter membrane subunit [Propionicimonas sp.]
LAGLAGLATMLVGILGAVAQSELKRLLSFTLVSHIGYMIFGISLASPQGYAGAIFYAAHHITIQATLFLVAGLVERVGNSTSLEKLGGLAKAAPLLALLFFIPAVNLAGIPPFSGFIAKLALLQAGIQDGSPMAWALVAGGVVTSLLTLYAMAKVWARAFWGEVPERVAHRFDRYDADPESSALPARMLGPTIGLGVLALVFTVAAGPMYDFVARAAGGLFDGSYALLVLGGVG